MNPRTLLIAVILLGLLGVLAWWQLDREQELGAPADRALLEGFDPSRVVEIRLDHLKNGVQLTLARGEDGTLAITDPLSYPAEPSVVQWLSEILLNARATVVPAPSLDGLGLAPPSAVLLVVEDVGGKRLERRIELGSRDLDVEHVFVRVDGVVARTVATLETVLDRSLPDWRSHDILGWSARDVVEVRREGSVTLQPEFPPFDMDLEAALTPGGWRATRPFEGLLDPIAMQGVVLSAVTLRARFFTDEATGRPEHVGLDRPALRIELVNERGVREALRFAPAGSGLWHVMREGAPHVWRVDHAPVMVIATPADALVDRQFGRFAPNEVEALRFVALGASSIAKRSARGWTVADAGGEELPGDARLLEGMVASILKQPFVQRVSGVAFEPESPERAVRWIVGGVEFGGRFGAPHKAPEGGEGLLFQRDGETVVFLVDASFAQVAATRADDVRGREVVRLDELTLVRAEVRASDRARRFVRSDKGRWSPDGVDQEARDFAALADRLIVVRAERWLPSDAPTPIEQTIEVAFTDFRGMVTSYRVGRVADRAVCEHGGLRAQVALELHADLVALLAGS